MNLIQALGKALRIPELRRKILLTVGLLLIFRVLASIPIPGANRDALNSLVSSSGVLGILNLFSGGGLRGFSIVGLGVNPYITATIIFQLMTQVSTRLHDLTKEGELGRQKLTRLQRWFTIPLAALQAFAIIKYFETQTVNVGSTSTTILNDSGAGTELTIMLTLIAGTIISMWIGELITEFGIGNGVSMIIFVGIIARLPANIVGQIQLHRLGPLLLLAAVAVVVTAVIIYVQQGERRVPTQSAQRIVNPRSGLGQQGGRKQFLPIRVNTAGVIPIIFAISLMQFPVIFANLTTNATGWVQSVSAWIHANWQAQGGTPLASISYNTLYFVVVFGFTFFYSIFQFVPEDVADNLKKSSTSIPGIRPGKQTAMYLHQVLRRITWGGALFLGGIGVLLPLFTAMLLNINDPTFYLGGTSILIVVGVGLDTMKQLEAQLAQRNYRGFIR